MKKEDPLKQAKKNVIENLQVMQEILNKCVEDGMVDTGSSYYNELIDLLEDAHQVTSWPELMEVVTLAKTLEVDIDTWSSLHGRSSISLPWPHPLEKS